jgi:hypothetical protein
LSQGVGECNPKFVVAGGFRTKPLRGRATSVLALAFAFAVVLATMDVASGGSFQPHLLVRAGPLQVTGPAARRQSTRHTRRQP